MVFVGIELLKAILSFLIDLPADYISIHLSKDKRYIILEMHLATANGLVRRWATLIETITGLLRSSINSLPSSIPLWEVRSGHPNIIPDVEVPDGVSNTFRSWASVGVFIFFAVLIKILINSKRNIGVMS